MEQTKTCTKCKEAKPATAEYFDRDNRRNGFQAKCKECRKLYREHNKEQLAAKQRGYYSHNKSRISEYERIRRERNKPMIAGYMKVYREQNKSKIAEVVKSYNTRNRDRLSKIRSAYKTNRIKTDPAFNLICRARKFTSRYIKGLSKSASTIALLGCTGEQAFQHIVSKFTEGMTVEALMRGDIHIDHIRPLASFDNLVGDPRQQQEAFHYTNLQPLWAIDNLRKGARYTEG